MTEKEYKSKILQLADISKELTIMLDERGQDLFEEYVEIYAEIVKFELLNK